MPAHNIAPSFLIGFLLPCTIAISISTEPQVALAKEPIAKTLLWEVSGNGLNQPSYLLGTIHIGCADRLALTPEQQKALKKSQQLYLEIDLTTPSKETDYKIPGGKKLKDVMTAAQYAEVEYYFGDLEQAGLSEVRPNILAGKIVREVSLKAYERICKKVTSKEEVLLDAVKTRKIPIGALENATDRNNALKTITIQQEVEKLMSAISSDNKQSPENEKSPEKYMAEIDKIHSGQDLIAICQKPNSTKAVTEERNRRWIPKMMQSMSQKATFFGFGAGHLCGEQGVISLLQAKGYKVQPIFDIQSQPIANSAKLTAEDYLNTGNDKKSEGKILEALDDYEQAIALNPQYTEAYYERGLLKKDKLKDPLGALADLDRATAINSKSMYRDYAYYQKGLIKSYFLNKYKDAENDFSQVIALAPNFLTPYYERGILRGEKLNDFPGALSDFNFVISKYPNSSEYHLARGMLKYNKLNDKPGGIADVRRAIKIARFKYQENNPELNEAIIILRMMGVPEKPTS
jgi:uncharacterized protein